MRRESHGMLVRGPFPELGYVGYELNLKRRESASDPSSRWREKPAAFAVFHEMRRRCLSMGFRGSPVRIRPSRLH